MKVIDRAALLAVLSEGKSVRLLEALPPKYFHEGHLPGAKQLDHADPVGHAERLHISKTDRVILYCASDACNNSHAAAEALAAAGYADVAVYSGGKKDWIEAGLPVEGARSVA
jgi:rhodanese-related sulfurtransferase